MGFPPPNSSSGWFWDQPLPIIPGGQDRRKTPIHCDCLYETENLIEAVTLTNKTQKTPEVVLFPGSYFPDWLPDQC